jgi:hypothetical protein
MQKRTRDINRDPYFDTILDLESDKGVALIGPRADHSEGARCGAPVARRRQNHLRAKRWRVSRVRWGAVTVCWLLGLICSCDDPGCKQTGPLPVNVAGEWLGRAHGWMGTTFPENDTTTLHLVLDQHGTIVGGVFRVGQQAGAIMAGYVSGDSVDLSLPGPEVDQLIVVKGRPTVTMMRGKWWKVDQQDMSVYLTGSLTLRRI